MRMYCNIIFTKTAKKRNLRKIILYWYFIFFAINSIAQQDNYHLSFELNRVLESSAQKLESNLHTSIKPYLRSELFLNNIKPDAFTLGLKNDSTCWAKFISGYNPLPDKKIDFKIYPLLHVQQNFSGGNGFNAYGGGLNMLLHTGKKLSLYTEAFYENTRFADYVHAHNDTLHISPGFGYTNIQQNKYNTLIVNGYLSYTPHRFFNFQAGKGKHFIGDGYRSLLLSDNAGFYPYLRISTTFWRIKYINLFTVMNDMYGVENNPALHKRKFVSAHYVNWNISKRLSFGIFESVIWQAKDTLQNRQFDINYLNPFVFYRPVEYSLGSSDNVLLGMNLKVKINDQYQIYGQLMLDEFLLKQIRADSGWWANKYAIQFGAKAIEPFGIKNLIFQSEYNIARPFIYSHGSVQQNYGHNNAPLAHPWSANFKEWVSIISYVRKNFYAEFQFITGFYGTDTTSTLSYGGNIYQSYSNRAREYRNYIGQGLKNNLIYTRFKIAYIIVPANNLQLFAEYIYRNLTNKHAMQLNNYISLGISTRVWNRYLDY